MINALPIYFHRQLRFIDLSYCPLRCLSAGIYLLNMVDIYVDEPRSRFIVVYFSSVQREIALQIFIFRILPLYITSWRSLVTAASLTARMSSWHTGRHAGHSSRWSAVSGCFTASTRGVISVSKLVHFSVDSASTKSNYV